jgi:hypothetical protein
MKDNPLTVQEQVVIIRKYKDIGITSKLKAFHIPTTEALPSRFYNGRIAYQYKNLRVGLTTLRKQPRCRILLTIDIPPLPF